jgi:hypothetical protein
MRPLLAGIDEADTVTLDLHKTAWQPAASSVLLVRDNQDFTVTTGLRVAYLNPDDDGEAGYDGLLDRSLQTTRRADRRVLFWAYLAVPLLFYRIWQGWYPLFISFIPLYIFFFLPLLRILVALLSIFLWLSGGGR